MIARTFGERLCNLYHNAISTEFDRIVERCEKAASEGKLSIKIELPNKDYADYVMEELKDQGLKMMWLKGSNTLFISWESGIIRS